jgi:hypothetical protein
MDPVLSPVLLKAAAGVASVPIARLLGRKTVRLRVSHAVARQARDANIRVSARALRRWLKRPVVQQQLRTGTAETVATVIDNLAWLLPGGEDQRARDAETVFFLVLAAFLRAQDPTAATALAHEWEVEHIQAEGRTTRQQVRTTGQAILDRFSASEVFTDQVRTLHPWRRDQAVAIPGSWPSIETVVHALTTAGDRGALLRQWAQQPPVWYAEAPAELACWLGVVISGLRFARWSDRGSTAVNAAVDPARQRGSSLLTAVLTPSGVDARRRSHWSAWARPLSCGGAHTSALLAGHCTPTS